MSLYDLLRKTILPLDEIDENLSKKGLIFDLGCGEGFIAKYIAKNKRRIVVGIDQNAKRLPDSNLKNLTFKQADLRHFKIPYSNGIVISDVLHHLNINDQKNLLKIVYKNLKKGGVLIIKEIDESEIIRSHLSRFWDFLLYPQDKIRYWDSKDLIKHLKSLGFTVKMKRATRLFPGSTNLFIARK